MSIRYTKKDEAKLKKKVRNYNAKIIRLRNKGYNENLLPQKLNLKEEREKLKNGDRKQFNNEFKIYGFFTDRNSEKTRKSDRGAILPLFREKTIEFKRKEINKQRKQKMDYYENMPITDRNKPIENGNRPRDIELYKLKEKKFNFKNMSMKELEFYERTLKEYNENIGKKNNLYRSNYYKSLENNLTPEQYKEITKVLDKIGTQQIIDKYYTDVNMTIEFPYEPIEQELKYNEIIESWNSVLKDTTMKEG